MNFPDTPYENFCFKAIDKLLYIKWLLHRFFVPCQMLHITIHYLRLIACLPSLYLLPENRYLEKSGPRKDEREPDHGLRKFFSKSFKNNHALKIDASCFISYEYLPQEGPTPYYPSLIADLGGKRVQSQGGERGGRREGNL